MSRPKKGGKKLRPTLKVKVHNKDFNKKVKRGKIKPKNNRSYQQRKKLKRAFEQENVDENKNTDPQDDNESEVDVTDMLESEVNLSQNSEDSNSDGDEECYEKTTRSNLVPDDNIRHLLPLKNQQGLIQQSIIIEKKPDFTNVTNLSISEAEEWSNNKSASEENHIDVFDDEPKSFVDLYVTRKTKLAQIRERIGYLSLAITEHPEENVKKFKDLLQFLEEKDPGLYISARKMAALSLVEVFKDVLPNYQIRPLGEHETNHKLKKETRQLQEYEQTLLRNYKKFLQSVEKWLENIKRRKEKQTNLTNPLNKSLMQARTNAALLALKCFSEILLAHPRFNMATNIIKIICEHSFHKMGEVSALCCETINQLLKSDKIGDVSFEAVKHMRRIIKMRNYNFPPIVLKTFLHLNVKEAIMDNSKKDIKKIREKLSKMSRKERQHNKKMQLLEKELLEAQAEESKQKKSRYQTDILEHVFLIYFHILKNSEDMTLLTPVLEGLSKFAHLINVDFFDDLVNVLYKLINSGKLGDCEVLHCLKTVFTILSGQGDVLNIDPQGFYAFLYQSLGKIDASASEEDSALLLDCLNAMLIKRKKKLTLQRTLAFIKRMATVSLHVQPNMSLALLSLVRHLLIHNPQTDILLDPENSGSGIYTAELNDPEHCNANATCLWELQIMRNHANPAIRKYAQHILLGCPHQGTGQIPPFLALKSAKELFIEYEYSKNLLKPKAKLE